VDARGLQRRLIAEVARDKAAAAQRACMYVSGSTRFVHPERDRPDFSAGCSWGDLPRRSHASAAGSDGPHAYPPDPHAYKGKLRERHGGGRTRPAPSDRGPSTNVGYYHASGLDARYQGTPGRPRVRHQRPLWARGQQTIAQLSRRGVSSFLPGSHTSETRRRPSASADETATPANQHPELPG
jgi:hypothetical protein